MLLSEILKDADLEHKNVIETICQEWKSKVQERLKDLMKISMPKNQSIKFIITEAYPKKFHNIVFDDDEYIKFILYQEKMDLFHIRDNINKLVKLIKNYPDLFSNINNEYIKSIFDVFKLLKLTV